MNRTFRTVSAFMRHKWLIEPVFAEQHLPIINAYLAGTLPINASDDEDQENEDNSDPFDRIAYAVCTQAAGDDQSAAPANSGQRYSLDDEEMPDGSVFVLDIRGAIFKESTCCSVGTEDYVQLINRAYAHPKIIGIVCLVDSPGGQLSGTPSLYDAIRDPRKPVVTVVNEGLMASAAYWLACGSDYIYATQKSDQIGSIGVFVSFDDTTEAREKQGIKRITVYSDRSSEKNKPFRDAMAGDTKALTEDLNQAADLFREAVIEGRGDRLKPVAKNGPDVFKGGLFYASEAIKLGLIDDFGGLDKAVAKVAQLAKQPKATTAARSASSTTGEDNAIDAKATVTPPAPEATEEAPAQADTTPAGPVQAGPTPTVSNNQTDTDMSLFGDKHKLISALAGVEASTITDDQLNAINASLDAQNIKGVRVISQAYLDEIQKDATALTAAQTQVSQLTIERDKYKADADKFGSQAGTIPTTSQKVEEKQGSADDEKVISETDQILIDRAAKLG